MSAGFAALAKIHVLAPGGRALCGKAFAQADRYPDHSAGERVWESGALPRCRRCEVKAAVGQGTPYDRALARLRKAAGEGVERATGAAAPAGGDAMARSSRRGQGGLLAEDVTA
jgi:hypothetical protein